MTSVYESSVIDAPVETVWTAIRDFGGLASWHPGMFASLVWENEFVSKRNKLVFGGSEIENGQPDNQIGVIRKLTAKDGAVVRERLLALDDQNHFVTYTILESPFEFQNYVATLR